MEILGVSRSMLTYYKRRGMPKKDRASWYLPDSIQWLVQQIKLHADVNHVDLDTRDKLYAAQTTTHELQQAKLRAELVQYDEAVGVLYEVSQIIVSAFEGLAPRLGGVLANMDNPAEIEEAIENEVRTCRELAAARISEYERKYSYGQKYSVAPATEVSGAVGRRKKNSTPRKPRAGAVA